MAFNSLKQAVKRSGLWRSTIQPLRASAQVRNWLAAGRPSPPPHAVKVRNILTLADIFAIDVLVETGTFRGDTIEATRSRFSKICSIEIYEPLASAARRRFSKFSNVHILTGDSAEVLPNLFSTLPERVLFWLDGHYSGPGTGKGSVETPVLEEVRLIQKRRGTRDVIIIDDARVFGSEPDYPPLANFLDELRSLYRVEPVHINDAIFILPPLNAAAG